MYVLLADLLPTAVRTCLCFLTTAPNPISPPAAHPHDLVLAAPVILCPVDTLAPVPQETPLHTIFATSLESHPKPSYKSTENTSPCAVTVFPPLPSLAPIASRSPRRFHIPRHIADAYRPLPALYVYFCLHETCYPSQGQNKIGSTAQAKQRPLLVTVCSAAAACSCVTPPQGITAGVEHTFYNSNKYSLCGSAKKRSLLLLLDPPNNYSSSSLNSCPSILCVRAPIYVQLPDHR